MSKLLDPIEAAIASQARRRSSEQARRRSPEQASRSVQHEVPMTPPQGATTYKLTVRGSDGSPIPVLHDPLTRITYPMPQAE